MSIKSCAAIVALAAVPILASVPAGAQPLPNQILGSGDQTIVSGRAHVYQGALGTYIVLHRAEAPGAVAGYIPFGDEGAFPDPFQLEGRDVAIHGVVGLYGMPLITMTSPDQLDVNG